MGSPVSATLESTLRGAIAGEVRFDAGSRALYATDASNYRQVPLGVVIPRDAAEVIAAVAAARQHGAPILGRGAGTSLAGQCCNEGVVFDFSKTMNRVLEVDPVRRRARVQPGTVLDVLRAATEPHHLTFGPDPATHAYCTLGGMIGNNSCGVHSVQADLYGPGPTTGHSIEELEVVTYRGAQMRFGALDDAAFERRVAEGGPAADVLRALKAFQQRYADLIRKEFPDIPRRVSGYNLPALLPENGFHVARALVGSESTLALVTEATVSLIPARPHRVLVVVGFDDVFVAADQVPRVMEHRPIGLEGFDQALVDDMRHAGLSVRNLELLPKGGGWLLVEFGDDSHEAAHEAAQAFSSAVRQWPGFAGVSVLDSDEDQHRLWQIRESGLAATARVSSPHPTWEGWEDSAVAPEKFGAYLREFDALVKAHAYRSALYGHFGQGCVHCRMDFDLESTEGIARFRRYVEEAADLVRRYGGSLSGEHGDGQARGELLDRMFSREMLGAFREFKSIWDPDWRMNPGKLIDARPLDANLRLITAKPTMRPATWFRYPEEHGSFAKAVRRCVGVGRCRKTDSETMCPSYMVTLEEKHSTRGRARLLFEMLHGDPLEDGWDAEPVREALDLCLACKACRNECPVRVDMATYKAEFLAHYYEGRWRPRHAYAFGLIRTWAALASWMPRLVNLTTQTPLLRGLAKLVAGMPQQRSVPAFAPQTFRQWFAQRETPSAAGGEPVMLWPDTFNDYFHPETLIAGVDVLERAGYDVRIPAAPVCCGRPLYDFGMLAAAKRRLHETLDALGEAIERRMPIVVLEPSCLSVFRDELGTLLPESEAIRAVQEQTRTLAELLASREDLKWQASPGGRVLLHGHCHQKALGGLGAEETLLRRMGQEYELLDSGCCGMAGSFGFERDHYEVSQAIGERVLLPAVRDSDPATVIVTDGFSCREQIAQGTHRRAVHLAQALQMAMSHEPPRALPERGVAIDYSGATLRAYEVIAAGLVAIGAGLLLTRLTTKGTKTGNTKNTKTS